MKLIFRILVGGLALVLFITSSLTTARVQDPSEWEGKQADGSTVTHADLAQMLREHEE